MTLGGVIKGKGGDYKSVKYTEQEEISGGGVKKEKKNPKKGGGFSRCGSKLTEKG